MTVATGIHHIASSLGIFGDIRQERQDNRISLTLGGKGTITYSSEVNDIVERALDDLNAQPLLPPDTPVRKKVEKIQTALRLFFYDQFPTRKLENKLNKYAMGVEVSFDEKKRIRHERLLQTAQETYEQAPQMENVLFVLGKARIGKSTSLNVWAGRNVELVDAGDLGLMNTREPQVIIARPPICGIGHTAIPKTKLPTLVQVRPDLNFCDCQGLLDLDPETELYNSSTLVEVLTLVRSIKGFAIEMAEQDLPDYRSVRNELKGIQMLLKDFQRFQNAIYFVFTKCRYSLDFDRRRLITTINDIILREQVNDPDLVQFLRDLLNSGILERNVKQCYPLNHENQINVQNRDEFLREFEQLSYPPGDRGEFGYPLSDVARLSFVATMTENVLKIGSSLDHYQGTILRMYSPQQGDRLATITQSLANFNSWFNHFPREADFILNSIIEPHPFNPFHQNLENLRSIIAAHRFITGFNRHSEQKTFLDRENAGSVAELGAPRNGALVGAEQAFIGSLNRLRHELVEVRSLLMFGIITRTLSEALESFANRSRIEAIKEQIPQPVRVNYQSIDNQAFAEMLTTLSQALASPLPFDTALIAQLLQVDGRRDALNLLLRDNLFSPYIYIDHGRTKTVQVPATAIALSEILSTVNAAAVSTLIIDVKKPNTQDGTLYLDKDLKKDADPRKSWQGKHIVLKADKIEIVNPSSTAGAAPSFARRIINLHYSLLHGGSISLFGIKAIASLDYNSLILISSDQTTSRVAYQWPIMGD